MPQPKDVRFFPTPAKLRAWLKANHATATDLWVGMYRKGTGKKTLTWPEVVDQALSFGWIDGVRYGLDDDAYATRLTPRKARSNWSAINIKRVGELEQLGLMSAAGRAAFAARDEARSRVYSYENRHLGLDPALVPEFKKHAAAWEWFSAQPPWYRNTAGYWVSSAKREETRVRRFEKLIEHSRKRERIPPLARP